VQPDGKCDGEQAENDEVELQNPAVGPDLQCADRLRRWVVLAATERFLGQEPRSEQHQTNDAGGAAQETQARSRSA
jgi:hypothetical protein